MSDDESAQAVIDLLLYVVDGTSPHTKTAAEMAAHCKAGTHERFLKEFERSHGRTEVRDAAAVSELPADEDATEAPAN
jgi:hypothetical protein